MQKILGFVCNHFYIFGNFLPEKGIICLMGEMKCYANTKRIINE